MSGKLRRNSPNTLQIDLGKEKPVRGVQFSLPNDIDATDYRQNNKGMFVMVAREDTLPVDEYNNSADKNMTALYDQMLGTTGSGSDRQTIAKNANAFQRYYMGRYIIIQRLGTTPLTLVVGEVEVKLTERGTRGWSIYLHIS
jgi:hypothetical protein